MYFKWLSERFAGCPFILDGYLQDCFFNKFTYLIQDPFDPSYNPARQIRQDSFLEGEYIDAMEQTLECCDLEGYVLFERLYQTLPSVLRS